MIKKANKETIAKLIVVALMAMCFALVGMLSLIPKSKSFAQEEGIKQYYFDTDAFNNDFKFVKYSYTEVKNSALAIDEFNSLFMTYTQDINLNYGLSTPSFDFALVDDENSVTLDLSSFDYDLVTIQYNIFDKENLCLSTNVSGSTLVGNHYFTLYNNGSSQNIVIDKSMTYSDVVLTSATFYKVTNQNNGTKSWILDDESIEDNQSGTRMFERATIKNGYPLLLDCNVCSYDYDEEGKLINLAKNTGAFSGTLDCLRKQPKTTFILSSAGFANNDDYYLFNDIANQSYSDYYDFYTNMILSTGVYNYRPTQLSKLYLKEIDNNYGDENNSSNNTSGSDNETSSDVEVVSGSSSIVDVSSNDDTSNIDTSSSENISNNDDTSSSDNSSNNDDTSSSDNSLSQTTSTSIEEYSFDDSKRGLYFKDDNLTEQEEEQPTEDETLELIAISVKDIDDVNKDGEIYTFDTAPNFDSLGIRVVGTFQNVETKEITYRLLEIGNEFEVELNIDYDYDENGNIKVGEYETEVTANGKVDKINFRIGKPSMENLWNNVKAMFNSPKEFFEGLGALAQQWWFLLLGIGVVVGVVFLINKIRGN